MRTVRHEMNLDKSSGAKARTLGVVLSGLLTIMTEREIIELLSPKNVIGGLEILREVTNK